jgi:hypothetical protein
VNVQPDLLSWQPPEPPKFLGATYDAARDGIRLNRQLKAVHDVMLDGRHRTLDRLGKDAGCPPASASARFRDLKRLGFNVQKENLGAGTWTYWMENKNG